jgi:sugar transferase EpsL
MYRRHLKRVFDLCVASTALVALAPLLLILAALVRIRLGAPVIFRQQRPGLHGRPFTMLKFRSMTDARDAEGNLLPDEQRLTPFGRFLRSSSLDELPELINVIRGDMSLVGPRPLLMEYLDRYTPEQMRRHEVRPGITGWAQVNGRNAISWDQKFVLDVWYVDHLSFWLDLRILALTVLRVAQRDGISQRGCATTTIFQGTSEGGYQ